MSKNYLIHKYGQPEANLIRIQNPSSGECYMGPIHLSKNHIDKVY